LIVLAYVLSGAAGLIHEVAWSRALGQSLGGSLPSLAIVLTVFLAGLAGGSALGGRAVERIRTPLRTYAWLEAGIAVWGLLSPAIASLTERAVLVLGPRLPDGAPLVMLRAALAALVLLPPTAMMGATFPVLVASRPRDRSARGVALLYGANTVAAAIGALAGSFLLLPLLSTRRTFVAAAVLNAAAAALAIVSARRGADSPPRREPDAPERTPPVRGLRPGMLAALSGAIGATLQFGWSRAMTFAFGSSVYALGLTLAASLLGLGLGPLLFAARGAADRARARRNAALAAWTVGATSLLVLPLLGALPRLAPILSLLFERSPVAALLAQFAVAFALLLLPAMAQGACLPLLVACASERRGFERAAGGVYAASTCGSALGFLAAGFLLVPRVGTRTSLALAGAAALLLCLLLQPRLRALPILATAAAGSLVALPAWDRDLISGGGFLYGPVYRAALADHPLPEAVRARGEILFEREDGDGLVTVRQARSGILSLQINGRTEASSGADMATQILAAHLPLLLHAAPRDVLVVGLASGVTVGAAERHPLGSVRVLEIARAVPAAAALFSEINGGALDDPRLDLVLDDARARLLSRDDQYDVVISQPSNPWVAGVANLFTADFYRLVRRRLRQGGLFCQWLQAYRIEPRDLGGIVRSFLEVFPEATLWEESAGGGDYFLVAGTDPLHIDPQRLEGAAPAVREDLKRAGVDSAADLLVRFVAGPRGLAGLADGARRHTDDDLYLEWRAPLALFTDTLRVQVSALQRHRESVLAYLPPGASVDPSFVAQLRQRLRSREARLLIADSLQEADLLALREPHLAAGLEALRGGRFTEAAATLATAAAASPGSATTHFLLGQAYRGAGLTAPAEVAFREAVARDPGLAAAWNALGLCLADDGRLEEARQAFETALLAAPGFGQARSNLGAVLLRTGDREGAERELLDATRDDPLLAAAQANLGLALRRRGDLEGAEARYREALRLDPLNADARFNLAAVLRLRGRVAEAAEQLREVLGQDPGDEEARRMLEEIGRPQPGRQSRGRPGGSDPPLGVSSEGAAAPGAGAPGAAAPGADGAAAAADVSATTASSCALILASTPPSTSATGFQAMSRTCMRPSFMGEPATRCCRRGNPPSVSASCSSVRSRAGCFESDVRSASVGRSSNATALSSAIDRSRESTVSALTGPLARPEALQAPSFCLARTSASRPSSAAVSEVVRYSLTASRSFRLKSASEVVSFGQMSEPTVTTGSRPTVAA